MSKTIDVKNLDLNIAVNEIEKFVLEEPNRKAIFIGSAKKFNYIKTYFMDKQLVSLITHNLHRIVLKNNSEIRWFVRKDDARGVIFENSMWIAGKHSFSDVFEHALIYSNRKTEYQKFVKGNWDDEPIK